MATVTLGADIEQQIATEEQDMIRYQVRPKTKFYAMVTRVDENGNRHAIFVKRLPAWLDTFSIKKLSQTYYVDLSKSQFVLKGLHVLVYELNNPYPLKITNLATGLQFERADAHKLFAITEMKYMQQLLAAVKSQAGAFNWFTIIILLLGLMAGALTGMLIPHAGTVTTVTTTVTRT
jgi:hypothetical protein